VAIFSKDEQIVKSGRTGGDTTLSIVSAGTNIIGDIECDGMLKVEGRITGTVRRARQLMLSREGAISGDVTANEVVIGGVVDGNITAAERVELQTTAVVNGEITTKSIIVMEGARINGAVKMSDIALVGREEESRDSRASRSTGR